MPLTATKMHPQLYAILPKETQQQIGRKEWTESGINLMQALLTTIQKNGGLEKYAELIDCEYTKSYLYPVPRNPLPVYIRRDSWSNDHIRFIMKNRDNMTYKHMSKIINRSPSAIQNMIYKINAGICKLEYSL